MGDASFGDHTASAKLARQSVQTDTPRNALSPTPLTVLGQSGPDIPAAPRTS